ncbi:ubiquinone biosynthesis accessory factor UbiJ [Necropsobacter massiliensis]|uniref:ubiquinone biosynthesis accessory factor UbiJ n=1 Tax=Necropsobacter massiliensis TaxID=1400001 RepID=UPI001FE4C8B7|nr:SCP2 domain-containing protein [Necropsobacter massiliensis]
MLKTQLMLPQLFNGGLETLLNYLLRRADGGEAYLRKLNGKVLALRLQKIGLPLYVVFSAQRIDLLHQYDDEPDCAVEIAANLLFNIPKKSQLSACINAQSIRLQGDLQVLQDFAGLLERLENDPAELISPYVGDVVAHSAVNFWRVFSTAIKRKSAQSQRYWGERLSEEWAVLAPSLAVADFCEQVKTLEKQTALFERKLADYVK